MQFALKDNLNNQRHMLNNDWVNSIKGDIFRTPCGQDVVRTNRAFSKAQWIIKREQKEVVSLNIEKYAWSVICMTIKLSQTYNAFMFYCNWSIFHAPIEFFLVFSYFTFFSSPFLRYEKTIRILRHSGIITKACI
jgi:hypothetical protein